MQQKLDFFQIPKICCGGMPVFAPFFFFFFSISWNFGIVDSAQAQKYYWKDRLNKYFNEVEKHG